MSNATQVIEKSIADWNAYADKYNQWHNLGTDEKLELVVKAALAQPVKPAPQKLSATDALRFANAIDPLTRKGVPDHLTMVCAARMLRALANIAQPDQPAAVDLRAAVDEMICHQLTGSKEGMTALQNLSDTAWRVADELTYAAIKETP